MKKENGSVTVFFALGLLLILSLIFSLLEAARVHCLKSQVSMNAAMSMQSVFGNYHAGLWKNYHLLFLDGAWGKENFSIAEFEAKGLEAAQEGIGAAVGTANAKNILSFTPKNVEVSAYELAVDGAGAIFRSQVSGQMQREAVADALDGIKKLWQQGEKIEEQKKQTENKWEEAWNALDSAEEMAIEEKEQQIPKEQANEKEIEKTIPPVMEEPIENPMEYVKGIKNASILSIVLQNPQELSTNAIENNNVVSSRKLNQGNLNITKENNQMDRLWLQYYIGKYFANAVSSSEKGPNQRALSYEMEYIISGKARDSDNLEQVVYELLAIREAANFITVMQDGKKKSLALGIATAAVGFTGLVPLIRAVQIGILLAWAFVESILDIRALLEGKKIPLIKMSTQWKSDIKNCRGSIEKKEIKAEEEKGLDYHGYLQILFMFIADSTINYRCMDLIEKNINMTEGNENVKMDAMISTVKADFWYEAAPLFWKFLVVPHKSWEKFTFPYQTQLYYGSW